MRAPDIKNNAEEEEGSLELVDSISLFPNLPPEMLSMSIGKFLEDICNTEGKGKEIATEIASILKGKHWSYLTERFFSENDVLELYKIIHEVTQKYQIVLDGNGISLMKNIAKTIKSLKGITSLNKLLNSEPSIDFNKITVANSNLLDIQYILEQIIEQKERSTMQKKEYEEERQEELKIISSNLAKLVDAFILAKNKLKEKESESEQTQKLVKIKKIFKILKKKKKEINSNNNKTVDNNENNVKYKTLEKCVSDLVDARYDLDNNIANNIERNATEQKEIEQLKIALNTSKLTRETLESNKDSYTEKSTAYTKLSLSLMDIYKQLATLFEEIHQKHVKIEDIKTQLTDIHMKKKDVIGEVSRKGGNMMVSGNLQDVPQYLSDLNRDEKNLINVVQNPDFQPTIDPFYRNKRKKELEQQQEQRGVD